ncbi:YccF domain-containing protein, partial [Xanthovirga aplysinae]|uniref:YccF domain-containing protein n=1 Tax=Xanthovirga aplysinae TaxID=2529853 RepID=UPI0012BB7CDA
IGIPFGLQSFKLAFANLAPFGKELEANDKDSPALYLVGNVLWIIFGGLWISLTHLFFGILLCLTVIGIPFGIQHFKLMRLSFTPFGYDLK